MAPILREIHWTKQSEYVVSVQPRIVSNHLDGRRISYYTRTIAGMKQCVSYRTSNYSYIDFYEMKQFDWARPVGYLMKLEVFVRGKSDFHILLSETNTPFEAQDLSYEFGKLEHGS